jgi:uncharacterized protein YxjI
MRFIRNLYLAVAVGLSFLGAMGPALASSVPVLPDHLTMQQDGLMGLTYLRIQAAGAKLGIVFEHLTQSLEWSDGSAVTVAKLDSRAALTGGAVFQVTDDKDKLVGDVQIMDLGQTRYEIHDAQHHLTATMTRVEIGNPVFTITDTNKKVVAVIKRVSIFGADRWDLVINDHTAVDARILLMIPSFKTKLGLDQARLQKAAN